MSTTAGHWVSWSCGAAAARVAWLGAQAGELDDCAGSGLAGSGSAAGVDAICCVAAGGGGSAEAADGTVLAAACASGEDAGGAVLVVAELAGGTVAGGTVTGGTVAEGGGTVLAAVVASPPVAAAFCAGGVGTGAGRHSDGVGPAGRSGSRPS